MLVGKLPAKEVLVPLLDRYLGAIPNDTSKTGPAPSLWGSDLRLDDIKAREALNPIDINFPAASVRDEVKLKMMEPKGSTIIAFSIRLQSTVQAGDLASCEAELRELFALSLLVNLLETRLVEVLRFKLGQVYSVSVSDDLSFSSPRLGESRKGNLSVSFECDPAEADELIEAVRAELDALRSGGSAFTDANVAAAVEQQRRSFEECFQKNDWWASILLDLYFSRTQCVTKDIGATLALWWRVRSDVVENFDVKMADATLQQVLPEKAVTAVVTMRPKGKLPPAANGAAKAASLG